MKSTLFAFLAGSITLLHVNGLTLEKRDDPTIISVPFVRNPSVAVKGRKRAGVDLVTLQNENLLYTASLKIGTPPQTTRVQIDTGSSYLIVETDSSNLCLSDPSVCTVRGAYDANSSSTYQYIDSTLNIQYGGGDGATGDNCFDALTIDGANIPKFRFGIMYHTTVLEGVFGISYPPPELSDGSLPAVLVASGLIPSRAYSLWLNDDRAATGQLLFGGIDTGKFKGTLVTIDLVPRLGETVVDSFLIPLLDITLTQNDGTTIPVAGGTTPSPALLDSGTTFTLFPAAVNVGICTAFGGSCGGSVYMVPCTVADTAATVNLVFAGITIHLQMRQLMFGSVGGATMCQLGLASYPGGIILGDTALSSMYVVYDMDNNQVSLAETIFNTGETNILQIMPGPNGVPKGPRSESSTIVPTPSSSVAATSSFVYWDEPSPTSQTALVSSSSTTTSSTSSSSTAIASSTAESSASSTTTATPATRARGCSRNNCFRAMMRPIATPFCYSFLAGIPVATPTNIVKGCHGLDTRILSACACLPTVLPIDLPISSSTSSPDILPTPES